MLGHEVLPQDNSANISISLNTTPLARNFVISRYWPISPQIFCQCQPIPCPPPPLRGGHRAAPARHGFRRGPTRRRCGALWGRPGTARPERSRKEAVKGAAEPGRAGLGQSRAGLGRSEPSPPPSGRRPRYRLTAARGRHPLPQRLRGRLRLARSAVTHPIPGG